MKAPRGCSPSDGGTLQKQVMPMDLDVYWCDGSVRERWKQDVPSTITRSINGLDSQNRSRTKDLVISIINNQHPLKRRTTKRCLEREQLQLERVPGTDVEPEADPEEVSCCGRGVCYCVSGIGRPPRDCACTQLQSVRRSLEIGPWELPLPEECCLHQVVRNNLGGKPELRHSPLVASHMAPLQKAGMAGIRLDGLFFDVLTAPFFQEKKP